MAHHYSRFARGSFGLVITENSFIDEAWSQTYVDGVALAIAFVEPDSALGRQ